MECSWSAGGIQSTGPGLWARPGAWTNPVCRIQDQALGLGLCTGSAHRLAVHARSRVMNWPCVVRLGLCWRSNCTPCLGLCAQSDSVCHVQGCALGPGPCARSRVLCWVWPCTPDPAMDRSHVSSYGQVPYTRSGAVNWSCTLGRGPGTGYNPVCWVWPQVDLLPEL